MNNGSPRKFRVALVGTGGISRGHATACQNLERAELTAVCDVSSQAIERFTQQFDVPYVYDSLDEMLAAGEYDVAVICLWGQLHAEAGIQLASSGRVGAVLCEKPFTQSAEEARAFVAACRDHGVFVAEAFKFRHHPMHLKAEEIVRRGGIGELLNVRSTFCTNVPPANRRPERNWRWNRAKGGGAIYDLACYNVHQARFIFDEEPESVYAVQTRGVEVDDAAYITLAFSGGRTAQLSVGFDSWASQYVEISGDAGLVRFDKAWNNENQDVALEYHSANGVETIPFPPTHQFTHQLDHLCDCLEHDQAHRISPESSIAQMRVLDAVAESMQSGKVVRL
ncbi:MAG: Gfo/Idh/MocA family oxidoreductase [Caldilineaceae bacterium]|nr:Gfo/Idh/MocA family oxidoreductase [Caldilineaceae bacterium]